MRGYKATWLYELHVYVCYKTIVGAHIFIGKSTESLQLLKSAMSMEINPVAYNNLGREM